MPKIVTEEELLEREQSILDAACSIIENEGFAGLTMDKVVGQVPFSKGSVYKQFGSTEEILFAITNSGADTLLSYLDRAYEFGGNTRERYLARAYAGFVYGQLHPIHFRCEIEALAPRVWEKVSPERLAEGRRFMSTFQKSVERFIRDATDAGDLVLPSKATARLIANTSWSTEFGITAYSISSQTPGKATGQANLSKELFWHVNTTLDGLQWKPFPKNFDYVESWTHIARELFGPETKKIYRLP